jgi:fatty-acyl-CoA synthase
MIVRDSKPPFRSHVERIVERARDCPDEIVLQDISRRVSAAQLVIYVESAARALVEGGVNPGAVVALVAPNTVEAVVARYAVGLLGCATVVCPHADADELLAAFVAAVQPDLMVYFPKTSAVAKAVLDRQTVPSGFLFDDLAAGRSTADAADTPLDTVVTGYSAAATGLAVLAPSGATTDESKASCRTFAEWLEITKGAPDRSRRQLICTPIAYIAQVLLDQTLLGGGTVVLRERFDAGEVLATIEKERITHLGLVEPWLVELVDHPDYQPRALSSVVAISHIGADAAPALRKRLLSRTGPVLAHPYGASEAGIVSILGPGEYDVGRPDLLGTAGRPLPGVEVRIVGPDGSPALAGGEGRIHVRSPSIAHGYRPASARSPFAAGWYDSGDLGFLDADGYLHLRGRAQDARYIDGRSVLPIDVQEALCRHPKVRYAVAVPLEESPSGFGAIVQVTAGSDVTPAELQAFVEPQAAHLVPAPVAIVPRVPVTEQGKPSRHVIAADLRGR